MNPGDPLPDGWRWTTLGNACEIVNGSTPKSGTPEYWGGEICWITPADLGVLDSPEIRSSARSITRSGYESCSTALVPEGSVILSSRAPIGHLGIATIPLCTNQGCKSFVPSDDVDSAFLYYTLLESVDDLRSLGSGATFAEVSKRKLSAFPIALPPLAEQRRIVAELEARLAAAERARRAAFSQLNALEAMPAALLRNVFERDATIKSWRRVEISKICEVVMGQSPPSETYRTTPEGLPFFQGKADFGQDHPTTRIWCVEPRKIALPGDILISVRAPVGPTNIADMECCIGRGLAAIRSLGDTDLGFVHFFLKAFESDIAAIGTGSTFQAISGKQLRALSIPLPPIEEQRAIVAELERELAATEQARTAARERLALAEALPGAILRRAFAPGASA